MGAFRTFTLKILNVASIFNRARQEAESSYELSASFNAIPIDISTVRLSTASPIVIVIGRGEIDCVGRGVGNVNNV